MAFIHILKDWFMFFYILLNYLYVSAWKLSMLQITWLFITVKKKWISSSKFSISTEGMVNNCHRYRPFYISIILRILFIFYDQRMTQERACIPVQSCELTTSFLIHTCVSFRPLLVTWKWTPKRAWNTVVWNTLK